MTPASDASIPQPVIWRGVQQRSNASTIGPLTIGPTLVTVLGLLATVLLLLLGLAAARRTQQGQEADQQNLRNQAAIRRLLDEMVDLPTET